MSGSFPRAPVQVKKPLWGVGFVCLELNPRCPGIPGGAGEFPVGIKGCKSMFSGLSAGSLPCALDRSWENLGWKEFKSHPVRGQGHFPLSRVVPSFFQPGLEHFHIENL